jgi:hypothetical protein
VRRRLTLRESGAADLQVKEQKGQGGHRWIRRRPSHDHGEAAGETEEGDELEATNAVSRGARP